MVAFIYMQLTIHNAYILHNIIYYKHEFYNDLMLFNYGSKLKPNMTQNNLPTMLPIDNLLVTKNLFYTAK